MNDSLQSRPRRLVALLLILVLVFGAGWYSGNVHGVRAAVQTDSGTVDIKKVINLYSQSRSDKVDFRQFWDIWDRVKSRYVDQPVDDTKLFYSAIAGMVAGLGDPYSAYLPPVEAETFAKDLAGEFEGIGAEIGFNKENDLVVIAPLAGSPAERAGLKANDQILAIDDTETAGLTLEQAVTKIRGTHGSSVVLTILRPQTTKVEKKTIVREKINVPTVLWEMKPNQIAYLRITYFNQDTWADFDEAVAAIKAKNVKGVVLDLRSNPGGFLDASVRVASEWVGDGVIVREKMNQGETTEHQTEGLHRFAGMPTVVLVDGNTASGSEIVAGALQDYGAATVIGQKTYGKGSVQDFEVLPDGSALKLTIARWYTPKDRQIDKQGIAPDVDIPLPEADDTATADTVLEKALQLLAR